MDSVALTFRRGDQQEAWRKELLGAKGGRPQKAFVDGLRFGGARPVLAAHKGALAPAPAAAYVFNVLLTGFDLVEHQVERGLAAGEVRLAVVLPAHEGHRQQGRRPQRRVVRSREPIAQKGRDRDDELSGAFRKSLVRGVLSHALSAVGGEVQKLGIASDGSQGIGDDGGYAVTAHAASFVVDGLAENGNNDDPSQARKTKQVGSVFSFRPAFSSGRVDRI